MRIVYKRHKVESIFPLKLTWVSSITTSSGYSYTQDRTTVVHDEEDLWMEKYSVEIRPDFMYWKSDWDDIERSLDESHAQAV